MRYTILFIFSIFFMTSPVFSQHVSKKIFEIKSENITKQGHTNQNKFKQLKELLPTPNSQHTASGAPGKKYTQQKVDYKMDIVLNDANQKITGKETITYHNNSEDELTYLWVQLDQNVRASDSKSPDIKSNKIPKKLSQEMFKKAFSETLFDGGFKITAVTNTDGSKLSHSINQTMMRINLAQPLASGATFKFNINWWYTINNHRTLGGRSGYEHFEKDGNNNYVIAQFYPRMCVYNNVEGWQNEQFWGRSEFALEFGDFNVNITVPADHMLGATGVLQNEKEVLSKKELKRLAKARKTYDNPVVIRTQKEAIELEKQAAKKTKTWKFKAKNVRDYAFATSRKFIWDAMAVNINGKNVMAYSLYSKEANPLYGEHSTRAVAQTLKTYSNYTFDYPYHKAISVDGQMGMEYPQICFNPGRPNADGTYSDRVKYRMIKVTIHEVGHNFFPMIVNSDERQWTWMDEGLNSYMEMLAELAYDKNFPVTRGYPKNIVKYMSGDQSKIAPIMSKGDHVYQFGNNAYAKPATALWILRETIMGHELFDHAFKTYAKRWKFKHPTPADFFRSMEDASAIDLDWFWRGWFYTTDVTDIGIKAVQKFYTTKNSDASVNFIKDSSKGLGFSNNHSKYHYQITYNKPGGLVMPILVQFTYKDGSKEKKTYPAQIWTYNDKQVTKVFSSDKELQQITIDPNLETADVDTSNNSWPRKTATKFDKFKRNRKK
ncbi:M1 family metallopeptidase [Tenacibaculum finnmarkense]|uniref:M1 family peptidase n=2 Tax=Tenacibaculum finnmarkense TaxID=2781243 RepID=A0AAP1WG11_9FLAO|nr:M1 family peptidase [Tenacibaculum finnmarkense genomovar finnmarkense]MCG8730942.1 M1 family metallopeptidase [Tenacibaculum finnmarkense]MBE7694897.1 M1 family peptidase [Tenacibaculum finnmarkense genomovar finnmarkense]MCG8751262.1 M1 family metallopeptidase [Tenacibaculum finnmarkense]MCG8769999.1 M1 family metallopeptidase [Tenacibaculum finnmarkense]